jgi:alkanesulfonate monooxygenase SsuD/methylene tetrahydromethanopterin reductase-like flavin-dependent oxidoreductase (luciferase family)
MKFGIMDAPSLDFASLAAHAERLGYDSIDTLDSPMFFGAPETAMTLALAATSRITTGLLVQTTRLKHDVATAALYASLNQRFEGRVYIGLGRGDSALRGMGERPATLKEFKESALRIRDLANGRSVRYVPRERPEGEDWYAQAEGEALDLQFPWLGEHPKVPLYIAAYGPKLLHWCGQHADGVILQTFDLDSVEWCLNHVRAGAKERKRALSGFEVICVGPIVFSGATAENLGSLRGYAALVSNHVASLVAKLPREEAPANLVALLEGKRQYDYREHGRGDADHASDIPEHLARAMGIGCTPSECIEKIKQLERIGVTWICDSGGAGADGVTPDFMERQAKEVLDHCR